MVGWLGLSGCECGEPGPSDSGAGVEDAGADGGSDSGVEPDAGEFLGCGLRTCASAGATCGPIGDGCGDILNCGECQLPQTCGGGAQRSVCGGGMGCVPLTCTDVGAGCGKIGDGCGNIVDCGGCDVGEVCGGNGAFQCGAWKGADGGMGCVKRTCDDVGANCGPIGDGCGGLLQCGSCDADAGMACGVNSAPSKCGLVPTPDAGSGCTGLCLQQVECDAGTTSLTGTVFAPNGTLPLYNAMVYVPNAAVAAFTPGVSCDRCDGEVSGSPLVKTTTDHEGKFTLTDVPAGSNIPVVIQLGRWRRQITVASVNACTNQALPSSSTRLPKNKSEGDIPLIGYSSGQVDALECVLRKLGVDDSEFTNPNSAGRIHMYRQNGARIDSNTPSAETLWSSVDELSKYDMVFFACEGGKNEHPDGLANVREYADRGGRIFATHYSFTWLYNNPPWGCGDKCSDVSRSVAAWNLEQTRIDNFAVPARVDTTFPRGQGFARWLDVVGASTALGSETVDIEKMRFDVDSDSRFANSQQWLTSELLVGSQFRTSVQHLTFNTPVTKPEAERCGRVVFSDFHVNEAADAGTAPIFPTECTSPSFSDQEKVLAFMMYDLANCIEADKPQRELCTPLTCAQIGANCGPAGDGCGGLVECGECTAPQTCGGGGVPSRCGAAECVPLTCESQGLSCGPAGDGCGGVLQCGECTAPLKCGGAGVHGQCGKTSCVPTTCEAQGANCGAIADGCGGTLDCGECTGGRTCGGSGFANVCGSLG